jgi:hypothetical protein
MNRSKLTLRPKPAQLGQLKHTQPPADPVKIALSLLIGTRYVSREGRYTQQVRIEVVPGRSNELTWVDVPLVPEVYG